MIYAAISLEKNEDFSVEVGQVLFAFNDENMFINPETNEFDENMLSIYLEKGSGSEYPERSLAEMFEIEWKEFETFPEVKIPKPPLLMNDTI